MLTTNERFLSWAPYQVAMNDLRHICFLPVESSFLIPGPATMEERETVADVDDCFENHMIRYVDGFDAIAAQ